MGTRAGREGPGRPRSSRADGSRWTCGASRSGCTATQTKAFLSIPASEIAAKLSREPQRQTSAPPPKRTHSLCCLKKKERKKEKCSICQNTTGTLSASSLARLAFLIWRIRQAYTEAGRSRPAQRLGRGVGGPRTALGCQPISPKNRNPRRHLGRYQSLQRWMTPCCTWTRSGQVVGATLSTPMPWPPHPGSHLCSGGREKDPPTHRRAPSPPPTGSSQRGAGQGVPGGGPRGRGIIPGQLSHPQEPRLSWGEPILGLPLGRWGNRVPRRAGVT